MGNRNFAAELKAARDIKDWKAHSRIWEERSVAEVEHDESIVLGNAVYDSCPMPFQNEMVDEPREIELTADWFTLRAQGFTPSQIVLGYIVVV